MTPNGSEGVVATLIARDLEAMADRTATVPVLPSFQNCGEPRGTDDMAPSARCGPWARDYVLLS